ncbi:MAG: carotenoid biosynthesis protein [Patescibacteria group bacterium]
MNPIYLAVILGALFFVGMGYLAATFGFDTAPVWVSPLAIIVIGIPAYAGTIRVIGLTHGSMLVTSLILLGTVIETIGAKTGIPYGAFTYQSDLFGPMLFGLVPATVGLAWAPLVLGATALAQRITRILWLQILSGALILVGYDLILDPGAVAIGVWQYESGGWYFGVPLSNFFGWLVSGSIGCGLTRYWVGRKQVLPGIISISLIFSATFWIGVMLSIYLSSV